MIYFISGHRDLTPTEFELYYALDIKTAINMDNHVRFVVGNYEGADVMALNFLEELGIDPSKVTVYCSNYSHSDEDSKFMAEVRKEFYSDPETADEVMTKFSDIDIAFIRPGKENSHTAKNILRRHLMND